jgi:hypothetical protein
VLDAFTHLLGCWGLDCLDRGDVIFPLHLGRLSLFGERPVEGSIVACQIRIREISQYKVLVDVDILHPDGTVWMQLRGWADWRFYWPTCYRDVFRAPDQIFVGETIELPNLDRSDGCGIWLEPPRDMARPVWRDVLECVQLAPGEGVRSGTGFVSESQRTRDLWARIAAKEAARRIWQAKGELASYPADLILESDGHGRLQVRDLNQQNQKVPVQVAIAQSEGVAAAIAMSPHLGPPGIILTRIQRYGERDISPYLDQCVTIGSWLDHQTNEVQAEWTARIVSAFQAAQITLGLSESDDSAFAIFDLIEVDLETGRFIFQFLERQNSAPILVGTSIRGEYALAWTHGSQERNLHK